MSYGLPLYFYQEFKEFPGSEFVGDQLWFMALEPLKSSRLGGGYKGFIVKWYIGKRKPDKAKHDSIHSVHGSYWPWREITPAEVPPRVLERFGRHPEAPGGSALSQGGKRRHAAPSLAAEALALRKALRR